MSKWTDFRDALVADAKENPWLYVTAMGCAFLLGLIVAWVL